MRKLSVEVHEDSGRPGGGHAVIRLLGLDTLPDSLTYRLKPVDSAHGPDAPGAFAEGDRIPLATRLTADGAELVVGPEIVENPAFLPGTLAVIEIAKCGVRGEFLWPRIAPLVRPKRRHLLGARPQRETKPEATPEIQFEEATDASSHLVPEPASPTDIALSHLPYLPREDAPAPSVVISGEAGGDGKEVPALTADPVQGSLLPKDAAPIVPVAPSPPVRDIAWTATKRPSRSSHLRLAAAAAVGGFIVLWAASTFFGAPIAKPAGRPDPDLRPTAAAREADGHLLARLLSVGPTSPRGVDLREASPQKLLEDADTRLHGPDGERDKTEAQFLLRRFLAATLAEDRTLWALTQLGSVYAEPGPGEARDYARARQLWEVASALGDPVAMCFLGSLHEHGLGVGADRDMALGWYRRSKDAGGCRDVDGAIARLQKGAQ